MGVYFRFSVAKSPKELREWGIKMQNCVYGYASSVRNGRTQIIGVFDKDNKVCSNIEIGLSVPNRDKELYYTIHQIKGHCNQYLMPSMTHEKHTPLTQAIKKWVSAHKLQILNQ